MASDPRQEISDLTTSLEPIIKKILQLVNSTPFRDEDRMLALTVSTNLSKSLEFQKQAKANAKLLLDRRPCSDPVIIELDAQLEELRLQKLAILQRKSEHKSGSVASKKTVVRFL